MHPPSAKNASRIREYQAALIRFSDVNKLLKNLPYLLPLLVLAGAAGYSLWFRELPQAEGRITGEYESARQLSHDGGIPLFVAVDLSPH